MTNFFYTDENGQRQGPCNVQQLQTLVDMGILTADSSLETDTGHRGLAGRIPGLKFITVLPPSNGNKKGIKSFVNKVVESLESDSETTPQLSRFTFIFLAAFPFTGMTGVHALYAKRNVMGLIHLVCMAPWMLSFLFSVITTLMGALGIQIQVDWFSSSSMQADIMRGPDSAMQAIQRAFGWWYLFFVTLPAISYAMALAQIVVVTKDGMGREFERF